MENKTLRNTDIQATHSLLALFEKAKHQSEMIIDDFPGAFCISNAKGNLLRANATMSSLYENFVEGGLNQRIFDLFTKENEALFVSYFDEIKKNPEKKVTFELPLATGTPFFWKIERFHLKKNKDERFLFKIIGQDVSELRKAEGLLNEIFSSIPLGICTIEKDGTILPGFSAKLRVLLQETSLEGAKIQDLLFHHLQNIKASESKALREFFSDEQIKENVFPIFQYSLPKNVEFKKGISDQIQYYQLNYYPVVQSGVVEKVLLVIEDQTELIREKNQEEKNIERILQIKKADPEILKLIIAELRDNFQKFSEARAKQNVREYKAILHAAKGNARVAGFKKLALALHDLETVLQDGKEDGKEYIDLIEEEWEALEGLYYAMVEKNRSKQDATNQWGEIFFKKLTYLRQTPGFSIAKERLLLALDNLSKRPLSDLEQLLNTRAQETAKALEKVVQLRTTGFNFAVHSELRNALSEILLHLVNNSISHGIEKNGQIAVEVKRVGNSIELIVKDNGSGINLAKVKRKAVEKGLMTQAEVLKKKNSELLQLIFEPGFSTAEKVDAISGRGVGLDAVALQVSKWYGQIEVENQENSGALFKARLQEAPEVSKIQEYVRWSDFYSKMEPQLKSLEQEVFCKIGQVTVDSNLKEKFLFINPEEILAGLGVWIGFHFKLSKIQIGFFVENQKYLRVSVEQMEDHSEMICIDKNVEKEFECAMSGCEILFAKHDGFLENIDKKTGKAQFGFVLPRDEVPEGTLMEENKNG